MFSARILRRLALSSKEYPLKPSATCRLRIITVTCLLFLAGCSSMHPKDFQGSTPALTLEDYFTGPVSGWGVVHDRSGKLIRQFKVDLLGQWDGQQLTLAENFLYSDGTKQKRTWKIKKIDEHTYEGKAGDVIGIAAGEQYGQALKWSYDLQLSEKEGGWIISFNDWMYLQADNVLINRAIMSKWGIYVGEVLVFFRKPLTRCDSIDAENAETKSRDCVD